MSILNFRRYARTQVDIPIQVSLAGSDKPLSMWINNISEEGASLMNFFSLPVATLLEFDLPLAPLSLSVHIKAEVLYTRPVTEDSRQLMAHGLMFRFLTIPDREHLHQFIAHSMSY